MVLWGFLAFVLLSALYVLSLTEILIFGVIWEKVKFLELITV